MALAAVAVTLLGFPDHGAGYAAFSEIFFAARQKKSGHP